MVANAGWRKTKCLAAARKRPPTWLERQSDDALAGIGSKGTRSCACCRERREPCRPRMTSWKSSVRRSVGGVGRDGHWPDQFHRPGLPAIQPVPFAVLGGRVVLPELPNGRLGSLLTIGVGPRRACTPVSGRG